MADNVRYILDKMAPLFKQLEEVELFSNVEVKSIIKRRTDFEYTLKRRQLDVSDFNTYLQYEITLEKLHNNRSKKMENNSKDKNHTLRSIHAAFIRHISYIFERAIRRFPDELSLWVDYIAFLKMKESNSILNTVFGRALSLHPKVESFWLQAAMHELEVNNNAHAARVILQRAIRVNKSSKTIWLKYFELELWNAVRVVERQKIMGLDVTSEVVEEGAPLIVFRHAMDSLDLTNHIEDILELHTACEGIAPALSESLEEELKARCGVNAKLWEYLVDVQVGRALRATDAETPVELDRKKRALHLTKLTVDGAVEAVTNAVTSCIELLTESSVALAEFTDDNDQPLPLDVDHQRMALRAIGTTIQQSAQVLAYALSPNTSGSEKSAKKARRSDETQGEEGEEDDSESEDEAQEDQQKVFVLDSALLARVQVDEKAKKALAKLKTPLTAVLQQLAEYQSAENGHLSQISRTTLSLQLQITRHQAWLLLKLLHMPTTLQNHAGALSAESLLAIVTDSASSIGKLVDASEEFRALVDSWASAILLILRSLSPSETLSLSRALVSNAPVLVCAEQGSQVVVRLIQSVDEAAGEDFFRSIVSGAMQSTKGLWCTKYLQFAVASEGGGLVAMRAAFKWVLDCLHSKPHLFAGTSLDDFFSFAATVELSSVCVRIGAFGSEDESTNDQSDQSKEQLRAVFVVVKDVAERAIAVSSSNQSFWDLLEEVERRLGNHTAANHIAWKKGRAAKL